jgi:hypothetical protein
MDAAYFATWLRSWAPTRFLGESPCRRHLLRRLAWAGLGLSAFQVVNTTEAKKKHRKKRKKKTKTPQPLPPPPPSSSPSPPDLRTRVDATCADGSHENAEGGDGNDRLAQTFTALTTGLLVTAQLPILKGMGSVGDFILRLAPIDGSGIPTNGVLAEATVANADVPGCSCQPWEASLVTFRFAAPATVEAGTQYALVLTRSGSDFLGWTGDLGNPCAGRAFRSLDQTAPFAVLAGASGFDFTFMTFVSS